MILFDYGHTLVWEKSYDAERGFSALLEHAVENPLHADAALITETYRRIQRPIVRDVVGLDYEMPAAVYDRAVYDLLGLEFDIPEDECQCVVWDASCPMEAMPGIRQLLDRLTAAGIRVGLVSNLAFSEYALRHRIQKTTGFDEWDLVVASSTYGFRKPSQVLFEIALRKAGLPAEDILFAEIIHTRIYAARRWQGCGRYGTTVRSRVFTSRRSTAENRMFRMSRLVTGMSLRKCWEYRNE